MPSESDIRYVHLAGHLPIGEKRNICCQHARGELIAHWDDDDYSAPGRLADQVRRLLESGLAVTGYSAMRFTDGTAWWQYTGPRYPYAIGTSLLYRRSWWEANQFRPDQVGEDTDFSHRAMRARQLVTVPAGDLMWATIHPQNTSKRPLRGDSWTKL